MQKLIPFFLFVILFTACNNDDDTIVPTPEDEVPVVQSLSTYDVLMEGNITYGEGLRHESINNANATAIPLRLDVYTPDNNLDNRPAFIFIHGGGFVGGSKRGAAITNLANFYTSRGWVFISIDYRLEDDFGTIPQEWLDFSADFPSDQRAQFLAIYPAQRDAKAAVRWVVANADLYNINTDYLTVGGGSAGAITAITVGISNPEDFRDEIEVSEDPTLSSTNLDQSYKIQTIVDFWGSKIALDGLEGAYGHNRFGSDDPPLFIAHGTEDPTVPYSRAEDLKAIYETNGVPLAFYTLEGLGHGPWNATVNGKRLEELAFDFIVEQQGLGLE